MKLTLRGEYGLLAMVQLARHSAQNEFVSVDCIAREREIPATFLEQILLTLKRAGYVQSRKGKGGGFRLARPANQISLAEIVRHFDGPLAPSSSVSHYYYASTPIEKEKKLLRHLKEIRDFIAHKLETTTLADVM